MIRTERGFTLVEVLFVVALIILLTAIATPSLSRARVAANEASAVSTMRGIASGQQVFWSTCGAGMYAPSLQNLGQGLGGGVGYISPELAMPAPVVKSGFEFDISTGNPSATVSCNGGATAVTYHATADPQLGRGRRYFGTNGSGTIFESPNTLFGVMPDMGAPPAPAVPAGR
jgi:type IV pilus assembly protein PilA